MLFCFRMDPLGITLDISFLRREFLNLWIVCEIRSPKTCDLLQNLNFCFFDE
ncbi:hypothetical protein LSS_12017 [Leptospira santarosai serovar Shermani str. LT 821]|uniref:Uncharacterized protein n=1 Tax=Leptospira santarosai serovar Shermani str. LT 821 TaxID=758847 RepID=K8Y028_9LEPT|nr:hypothetical protein LSS_12017 [Leptospira santarosai serovar Shermani str. LT 821]